MTLKKVILILKLSRQYLQIPNDNLVLYNMWRVSGKLANKLMRKAELVMVANKGCITLKLIGEVTSETPVEKPADKVPRCHKRKK